MMNNRICGDCKLTKPLSEFESKLANGKVRRHVFCASCRKERRKDNYDSWYRNNSGAHKERSRECYTALRAKVLAGYGCKCQCCGETEPEFLCVDHVNNDGYLYRKNIINPKTGKINKDGPHITNRLLRFLVANGFPDDFQLLCHNCNHSKRKFGVCIHQIKQEGLTTIPLGSRIKRSEAPTVQELDLDGLDDLLLDDDIVSSAR